MKTPRTIQQMICFSTILFLLTVISRYIYNTNHQSWMLSMYVTLLTVFYHFAMRLAVGEAVTAYYRNRSFNMNSFGFRIRSYETKLYEILKVKKWKSKVITAKPEQFDIRIVSTEELIHNMLQAELVHRYIMVLSFLPLLLIIPYGEPAVFIATSVLACMADSIFVIIQRYNRPRVIRMMKHYNKTV